jgi:cell division protein FtsB
MDKHWQPGSPDNKHSDTAKKRSPHDGPASHAISWIVVGGVAVALLLFIFLGLPAMKGYNVYKAMKASGVPEEYATDMQGLSARLAELEAEASAAAQQRDSVAEQLTTVELERQRVQSNVTAENQRLDRLLTICTSDANNAKNSLRACQDERDGNDAIIEDAARRICCIARYNDPSITGYEIRSNSIVCVSKGGQPVNC